MDKQIVFLSGLPRTGSTLLTSILSQNPNIYVDGQSPLVFLMLGAKQTCEGIAKETLQRVRREGFEHEWLSSIPNLYYKDVRHKFIIDKNRAWSHDSLFLRHYITPTPRILVMLRPITEIVRSFVFVNKQRGDVLPERNVLSNDDPLRAAIINTGKALANDADDYFFVTYEQLINDTSRCLDAISNFWDLPNYDYDLTNIVNPKPENDLATHTRGLHDIRPQISRREYDVKVSDRLGRYAQELDDALSHDYMQAKRINPERFFV